MARTVVLSSDVSYHSHSHSYWSTNMLACIAILTALASAPHIAGQSAYYPPPPKTYSGPALQLDVNLDAGIYVESTDASGGAWGGCGGGFEFEFKDQYTAEPFEMRLYKTNDLKCKGKPTAKAQVSPSWGILSGVKAERGDCSVVYRPCTVQYPYY